jgi:radical SAM superfamily enzyme YgiQ (UPF0313 family)
MRILIANLAPFKEPGPARVEYTERMSTLHFPLGLGLVASALKSHGYSFSTYDSYVNGSLPGFLEIVERTRPEVVMMSGFLGNYQYPFIDHVSQRIKEESPSTRIIVGGPMATTVPHLLAKHTDVDIIVVGEGERTIVDLMDAIRHDRPVSTVKGVFLGRYYGASYVGPRDRIPSLEIWPDYQAFPVDKYIASLRQTGRCWEISTSRGCWGRCTFCKLTFGRKISYYPLPALARHIAEIVDRYGIRRFNFVDDNFLNSSGRIEEFLSLLRSDMPAISWRFQGRADAVRPGDVERMIAWGLFDISFGLESGSQEMLNRYRKGLDLRKAVANLLDIRTMLDFHATFILGGPGENWETVLETELLINKLRLRNAHIGLLTLFPGTGLYEDARRAGLIPDEDEYCRSMGPAYERVYTNISDLSDDDLLSVRDRLVATAASHGESATLGRAGGMRKAPERGRRQARPEGAEPVVRNPPGTVPPQRGGRSVPLR